MTRINTTTIIREKVTDGRHYVAIAIDHVPWFIEALTSKEVPYTISDIAVYIEVDGETHMAKVFDIGKVSMYSVLAK